MTTAPEFPLALGEPAFVPAGPPALRLVPSDPLDFDDAVKRVRPHLHRYAVRRLGDAHEAEELVQEALLRAYAHREQLHTADDLAAWTTVVTGRLVIDRLRVRSRSTSVADVPEDARLGRATAEVVVARDEARTALDALDAMPTRQAALLWAREVEGHSYEELCGRFGMTEPAVRSVLTRARKSLRQEYARRGGTLPVGGLAVLAPWLAGLSWANKLRRLAGRVTGPAMLATIGITALGGMVLSPLGPGSMHTGTTFTPAQAVVTSQDEPVDVRSQHRLRTAPAAVGTARPAVTATVPSARPHGALTAIDGTCGLGSTRSGGPGVGGKGCSGAHPRHDIYVNLPLPAPLSDATGYSYLHVETSDDACQNLPDNPALKCTDRTKP